MHTIIENTDRFRLDSISNGAAYEMTDKQSGESKFAQYGDDATAFRSEYDAMAAAYSNPDSAWHRRTWNACLSYLFCDCI